MLGCALGHTTMSWLPNSYRSPSGFISQTFLSRYIHSNGKQEVKEPWKRTRVLCPWFSCKVWFRDCGTTVKNISSWYPSSSLPVYTSIDILASEQGWDNSSNPTDRHSMEIWERAINSHSKTKIRAHFIDSPTSKCTYASLVATTIICSD